MEYLPLPAASVAEPEQGEAPIVDQEEAAINGEEVGAAANEAMSPIESPAEVPNPVSEVADIQPVAPEGIVASPQPGFELAPGVPATSPATSLKVGQGHTSADTLTTAPPVRTPAENAMATAADPLPADTMVSGAGLQTASTAEAERIQRSATWQAADNSSVEVAASGTEAAVESAAPNVAASRLSSAVAGLHHRIDQGYAGPKPSARLSVYPLVLALLTALGLAGQRFTGLVPQPAYN